MRCMRCGKEVDDGARFCSGCGIRLQTDSQIMQPGRGPQVLDTTYSERMEIIRRLDKALPIYQAVENMDYEIQTLSMKKIGASQIGAAELIVALCISGALSVFVALLASSIVPFVMDVILSGVEYLEIMCVTFFVSCAVVVVIEYKAAKRDVANIDKVLQSRIAQRKMFLEENYTWELNYLPEKYRYVIAAQYIRECIVNQRAHNLTDAINLYEEQLYRWKMEDYQRYLCAMSAQKRVVNVVVW